MFDDWENRGHSYENIISVENLLAAWREFLSGKRKKQDVQEFQHQLMDNILQLHQDLKEGTYMHGPYHAFKISDPKPRDIHKATVRDRLLHHAIYRVLYPSFDSMWITDSYSCRDDKGTHKAMDRFHSFANSVSSNYMRTCWILKCDIRKFFASIDHVVLLDILSKRVPDAQTRDLISRVVASFQSTAPGKGLPLGNLTSQMLVNVYMNEFDQFVKHELRERYYIRYADDFVILSPHLKQLQETLKHMVSFLEQKLKLSMHPDKVHTRTISSGVDFLGWVHFSNHRILRTSTKRRMIRNLNSSSEAQRESYRSLLGHGNSQKMRAKLF